MPRGIKLVPMERRTVQPEKEISPALKSWIRNAVVPALLREWKEQDSASVSLAPQREEVVKTRTKITATAERISG